MILIAKTPAEKRELAEYLVIHDPVFLELVKAASETFGTLRGVAYKSNDEGPGWKVNGNSA